MNKKIIFLFCFCLPLFCIAQTHSSLGIGYDYDAAGNRILRKVVLIKIPKVLEDSLRITGDELLVTSDELQVTNDELQVTNDELQVTSYELQEANYEYFVEKLDKVEIKIYPNPTTERVTLEISGWQELKTGRFQLYSLMGQLLQDSPVYSLSTEINLSGLTNGAYILRVFINDETEEWKIIKQ